MCLLLSLALCVSDLVWLLYFVIYVFVICACVRFCFDALGFGLGAIILLLSLLRLIVVFVII